MEAQDITIYYRRSTYYSSTHLLQAKAKRKDTKNQKVLGTRGILAYF